MDTVELEREEAKPTRKAGQPSAAPKTRTEPQPTPPEPVVAFDEPIWFAHW